MNIKEFKKGDRITRVEKSIAIFGDQKPDASYIGDELEFAGMANNCIYILHPPLNLKTKLYPIQEWEEGWEIYREP